MKIAIVLTVILVLIGLGLFFFPRRMRISRRIVTKFLYKYRWWALFSTVMMFFVMFWLCRWLSGSPYANASGTVNYLDFLVKDMDFPVYIGICLSFLGCVIGVFVLEQLRPDDAANLNQFLDMANDMLSRAEADDEVVFLLPTFYIGGRTRDYEHLDFLENLEKASGGSCKLSIYCVDYDQSLHDGFLNAGGEAEKLALLHTAKYSDNPLVKFNMNVWTLPHRQKRVDLSEYFESLFKTAKLLCEKGVLKKVSVDYLSLRIVCILNRSKKQAFLGAYTLDKGIVPTGHFSDHESAFDAIKKMTDMLIDSIKI